jgi:hypothetical protein
VNMDADTKQLTDQEIVETLTKPDKALKYI